MTQELLQYATYFDQHYLTRGLALYRSLVRHSPPFRLWVLCLDDATYDTLRDLKLEYIHLIPLSDLEQADPALLTARPDRQLFEYYWTCGPAYLLYLLERQPEIELLIYLDADLYFFGNPAPLYDQLGNGSILVIERRPLPSASLELQQKGTFNVGMLVFRRDSDGLAALHRWRSQCLDWCFDRVEPTRFGDQKYLDEWPALYAGVVHLQHQGAELASYNFGRYRIRCRQGTLFVEQDPLVFYHFTRLRILTDWLYDAGTWGHDQRLEPIVRRQIYVPYVRELRAMRQLVRAAGGIIPATDNLRWTQSKLALLGRMLRHGSFILVTERFAL
jgi:hypothetical protein